MPQPTTQRQDVQQIRETYEEYRVGTTDVGMISDPENEYAWIQSDVVQPIVA